MELRRPSAPSPARALSRDRFVQISVAAAVVEVLFYALPIADREEIQRLGEGAYLIPFVALAAAAAFDRGQAPADINERRFWRLVGVGFTAWVLALGAMAALPLAVDWSVRFDIAFDGVYLLVYAPLLAAFEYRPHVPARHLPRQIHVSRQLRWAGLVSLFLGWFAFFVVIPVRFDLPFYESMLPSALLYLAADVLLIVRIAVFAVDGLGPGWRPVYGAMLAGAIALLGVDLLEAATFVGRLDIPGGTWMDFAWIVPPFLFLLGARWRAMCAGAASQELSQTDERDLEPERAGSLLISAAASFPIANITQQTAVTVSDALEQAQDSAALLGMLSMAALAAVAYYVLDRDRLATERANDEQDTRLREATTLAAVSRLAAATHRDVGGRLAAARAELGEIAALAGADCVAGDRLAAARAHLDGALAFTQRLKAISRQLPLRASAHDLNTALDELAPAVRELTAAPVRLELKLGSDAPRVVVDPGALREVLLTLAENACEAMPNGGTLTLASGRRELRGREAAGRALRPGRYGRITVRDTGLGMSGEAVRHAFEPFFHRHDNGQGRGLGLAAAHAVIAQHGGTVSVTSALDAGTTFEVLLPAADDDPPARLTSPD